MKVRLPFISPLVIIIILIGVYFFASIDRGTINNTIQNSKIKSNDSKTKIADITKIKAVSPITNEDFVIKDKNNDIELGGKYGDLKTNEKITKTVPDNEIHAYFIYIFENFKILTQPCGDTSSIIGSITLTTPIIQTSRGIRIGDTKTEVAKKYGNPDDTSTADSITPGQYVYRYNGKFLTFIVDKIGKVVGIRFESV
ncbi:MAG: hypothetical protein Q8942_18790 [Bacillota bacterium]|nr:hypothetical protein [Bacillota bacterium]